MEVHLNEMNVFFFVSMIGRFNGSSSANKVSDIEIMFVKLS